MKTILSTIAFIVSFVASAQNVAVLTHGAAGTEEFKRGCPAGWPYVWKDIGKSSKVPDGLDATWIVMTNEAFDNRFKELDAAKEAWNKQQEEAPQVAEEQAKAARKAEVDAVVTEVEVGLKEWQVADEKQKGDVLLKLLQVIIDALRSLGSDVKQISISK